MAPEPVSERPSAPLPEPLVEQDEFRHPPDPDLALWNESWYLDFATAEGRLGGYVRFSLYPNEGVAWVWACLVGEGRELVAVARHDLPLPRDPADLGLRAPGIRLEQSVTQPFGEVTVHLSAQATRHANPEGLHTGAVGVPAELDLELTWRPHSGPYPYPGLTRYEVPCTVQGRVRVDDEILEVVADGERDHSWGHRDWWAFPWMWTSGRLDDGTFVHGTKPQIEGLDYEPAFIVPPGRALREADGFRPEHVPGEDGVPLRTDARLDELALRITPLHPATLRLDAPDGRTTRLVRALCRFDESDGRSGYGWSEWNQPDTT